MLKILAGIVTFNPDLGRLEENINAVVNQVDDLIIVDNGSDNLSEIKRKFTTIKIIELNENLGIACALNKIGVYAIEHQFDWFLTLDQDTIVKKELIATYKQYKDLLRAGMLTCLFQDLNKEKVVETDKDYEVVEKCITSAALMKTEIFKNSDGFDEQMFIDLVDYDINYHYSQLGYYTYRINKLGFYHEVGNAKQKKLFGKVFYVYNHSAFRKYYMIRNALYLDRKYGKDITKGNTAFIRDEFIRVLLFESEKRQKLLAMIKGLRDGLMMKVKRNED
ncbi:glycosyltransferase [Streptococcus catagoni]|uniref:glycosyltransferase n=1 Tax=Streptococcus catagoni TaxID=2654874 RepID=UPI00140DF514|nr:glycosyltransferase [Streptococcus catagoni]